MRREDQSGKDREAVVEYRRALVIRPLSVEVLNNLAWILATSPDDSVRNGSDAVGFAEKACQQTQNQDAMTLGTLAAAYAEAGRFSDAVATADKAASLAAAAGNSRFATINTQLTGTSRVELFFKPSAVMWSSESDNRELFMSFGETHGISPFQY